MPVLIHARDDERAALDALDAEISPFAELERLDATGVHAAVSAAKGRRACTGSPIATASGSIRTRCFRAICASSEAAAVSCDGQRASHDRAFGRRLARHALRRRALPAPILVNAAGSWADEVARLAASRRSGSSRSAERSSPSTRRPAPLDRLPFAKTVGDELYFAPESGRLFASPMDEVPSDPCDAQPDELEVALAAHRMEERTTVKVERIHGRWAGLRTFTPDRRRPWALLPTPAGSSGWRGRAAPGCRPRRRWRRSPGADRGEPWPVAEVTAEELDPAVSSGRRHRSTQLSRDQLEQALRRTSTDVFSDPPAG